MIGGGARSGYKELKRGITGPSRAAYYEHNELSLVYPFVADWEKQNKRKLKYEERKSRIVMRGVKIGSKKDTGRSKEGMSMFEMTKSKYEV